MPKSSNVYVLHLPWPSDKLLSFLGLSLSHEVTVVGGRGAPTSLTFRRQWRCLKWQRKMLCVFNIYAKFKIRCDLNNYDFLYYSSCYWCFHVVILVCVCVCVRDISLSQASSRTRHSAWLRSQGPKLSHKHSSPNWHTTLITGHWSECEFCSIHDSQWN